MAKAVTPPRKGRGSTIKLPSTVVSEEAEWPGSNRGGHARNRALREQIAEDLETMEVGSVRKYEIAGDKAQNAFLAIFRNVCDRIYGPIYGVQAVKQDDVLFVRLGNRRGSNK